MTTTPSTDGGASPDELHCRRAPRPSVSLMHSALLKGKDQYLGGECATSTNSQLYFIPGNASRVLVLDPKTDELRLIGPTLSGQYKWLRGVENVKTGIIYGLPCHSDSVLRIDPTADSVTTLPIPPIPNADDDEPAIIGLQWKYHGGNISPVDGKIYAIPQKATRVLCIDPATDEVTHVGPRLNGWYKWYGGLVGRDGCLYGMPQNAGAVLRINPAAAASDDIVTLHGDFGEGGHKWHGGGATAGGTAIFGIPCNGDQVLRVDPPPTPDGQPTITLLGDDSIVKTGRHRSDRKYKFLGAVSDDDNGYVYFIPSGADRVLRVHVATNQLEEVGPHMEDGGLERVHQNKWQNGFFSKVDRCVYAIPLNGDRLLRIDSAGGGEDGGAEPIVETLGPSTVGVEKWEGAVIAANGVAYSCPNNYKGLLKIVPAGAVGGHSTDKAQEEESGIENTVESNSASAGLDTPSANGDEPGNTAGREKDAENHSPNGETKIKYQHGIPTLRSATHRVRYSAKKAKGREKDKPQIEGISGIKGDADETFESKLPMAIRGEHYLTYNTEDIDMHGALVQLLSDPEMESLLGGWSDGAERRMENFTIPPQSLNHRKGGQVAEAQDVLSHRISTDEVFLDTFDRIVMEVVLPWLKERLVECGYVGSDTVETTFYYQRPPTLRLQPGPSRAVVKPHCDSIYGHQDGELNFWLPLMNNDLTGTYLWAESMPNKGDYHPLKVQYGEIAAFHGSYCRHYVPANETSRTRASLDFRVGIQGLFDPDWSMIGTRADHNRCKVTL